MDRSKYASDWPAISQRVREAAGNRCQQCGVRNGSVVFRSLCGTYWYDPADDCYYEWPSGELMPDWREAELRDDYTRIVLTVAHLDAPGDVCRCELLTGRKCGNLDHLRVFCQKCHLAYDSEMHQASRRRTAMAKKAIGDLFEVAP